MILPKYWLALGMMDDNFTPNFKILFNLQSDLLVILRENGVILETNNAWKTKLNWERTDLQNKSVSKIIPPEDLVKFHEILSHFSKDKSDVLEIICILSQTGEAKPFSWKFQLVEENNTIYGIGKELEFSGKDSIFSRIFQIVPVGIGIVVNRIIKFVNKYFVQLTGYSEQELLEKSTRLLYDGENEFRRVGELYNIELKEKGFTSIEAHWKTKTGNKIEVLIMLVPFNPKNWDEGIVFSVLNISEKRHFEDELRQRTAKLESIIRIAPVGIAILKERIIKQVNPYMNNIIEYTEDEVIDRTPRFLYESDEEYQRVGMTYAKEGLKKGILNLETRWKTKSGKIRNVLINFIQLDFNNPQEGTLIVCLDYTEKQNEELKRLEYERQLQHAQRLESLGVLTGGIAHDFNNLLFAIMGNIDLALLDISPEAVSYSYLKDAQNATKRSSDLTRQMLAYSGKAKFVMENININKFVLEIVQLIRSSISKNIQLNFVLTEKQPIIYADPSQMEQIILNLVINGSEAIGQKNGEINIRTGFLNVDENFIKDPNFIEKVKIGEYIFIEVEDTGCGMTDEVMSHIFEPFFTTKFKGRGLGLSAIRGIVRSHNGGIYIDTFLGRGTIFRLLFPPSQQSNTSFKKEDQLEKIQNNKNQTKTILIAEDEATLRQLDKNQLNRLGFNVLTASNGEEAIKILKNSSHQIDLVLLDLTMPVMNGEATLLQIQKIHPEMKVILMSGYDESEVMEKFKKKGVSGFLHKPYLLNTLEQVVNTVLYQK